MELRPTFDLRIIKIRRAEQDDTAAAATNGKSRRNHVDAVVDNIGSRARGRSMQHHLICSFAVGADVITRTS